MLLAVDCAVCGAPPRPLCPGCLGRLRPAPELVPPPGLDSCRALLAYEGAARELLAGLKYRNHRSALGGLGRAAASLVCPHRPDVVTWAPTTAARRGGRGFDQAELLARVVGRSLGSPVRRLLVRASGEPQTGRGRAERWAGPSFTVAARRRLHPGPLGSVLVVDDVVTTGATMAAAARALRPAGAGSVHGLAIARTPPRPPRTQGDHSP